MNHEELKTTVRELRTDAVADYRGAVSATLMDARRLAETLESAIGECSSPEAFAAWKHELVKRLQDEP